MEISPYPLLMTVAIAASTAFSTPVASPVNTLVLGPGGYKFNDFVKLGVPLQLLVMALTLLLFLFFFRSNELIFLSDNRTRGGTGTS